MYTGDLSVMCEAWESTSICCDGTHVPDGANIFTYKCADGSKLGTTDVKLAELARLFSESWCPVAVEKYLENPVGGLTRSGCSPLHNERLELTPAPPVEGCSAGLSALAPALTTACCGPDRGGAARLRGRRRAADHVLSRLQRAMGFVRSTLPGCGSRNVGDTSGRVL
jgi:hypothetical protein